MDRKCGVDGQTHEQIIQLHTCPERQPQDRKHRSNDKNMHACLSSPPSFSSKASTSPSNCLAKTLCRSAAALFESAAAVALAVHRSESFARRRSLEARTRWRFVFSSSTWHVVVVFGGGKRFRQKQILSTCVHQRPPHQHHYLQQEQQQQ